MTDDIRTYAGDCTVRFEGTRERTQRGRVVVVVKPDDTVLVHDADGYQPVAWLTRADEVAVDDDGFRLVARAGDRELRVTAAAVDRARHPVTEAGVPVGTCPDCGGPLVRAGGDVTCLDCGRRHGLPAGATVLEATCEDCGLPLTRVERGEPLEVCVDPGCDPLHEAVSDALDGAHDCPDCGEPLAVKRAQGRSFLGCTGYPDCEATFSVPAGVVVDDCDCGLPVFETATGRRCLDGTCDAYVDAGRDGEGG